MLKTRIRTFYPADPAGVVPGGVDTFIRGIAKWAPDDFEISLVGMTTDEHARPVRKWTRCSLGRREFDFFPAIHVPEAGKRSRLPLSLRYTTAVMQARLLLAQGFDVFEYHRIEPGLLFLRDNRPKNAFFHQDMAVIRSAHADIVWRRFPSAYFLLERAVVRSLSSAYCVRKEGADSLARRYPEKADAIRFVPTWVDGDVFTVPSESGRLLRKQQIAQEFDLMPDCRIIVSVGRLDTQKDPSLLIDSISELVCLGSNLCVLLVGDGALRTDLVGRVSAAGLNDRVRFLGLRSATQIAQILHGADVFALSSAYEGMPMALLEALGSGIPVVTTDVGEVRRVVRHGINGMVSADRSLAAYSSALQTVIDGSDAMRGEACAASVREFQPGPVLEPVFENYRRLSHGYRKNAT